MNIPDHAVGRPALVRCAWDTRPYTLPTTYAATLSDISLAVSSITIGETILDIEVPDTDDRPLYTIISPAPSSSSSSSSSSAESKSITTPTDSQKEPTNTAPPTTNLSTNLLFSSSLNMTKVVTIATGYSHSIAVTAGGTVFTWGCGTSGRLGHGSDCDEFTPKQVTSTREMVYHGR